MICPRYKTQRASNIKTETNVALHERHVPSTYYEMLFPGHPKPRAASQRACGARARGSGESEQVLIRKKRTPQEKETRIGTTCRTALEYWGPSIEVPRLQEPQPGEPRGADGMHFQPQRHRDAQANQLTQQLPVPLRKRCRLRSRRSQSPLAPCRLPNCGTRSSLQVRQAAV